MFASARRGTLILAGGISVARWLLVLFSVCDRVIASECEEHAPGLNAIQRKEQKKAWSVCSVSRPALGDLLHKSSVIASSAAKWSQDRNGRSGIY